MMSYVSLLVTIKHHLEEGSIGITRERGVRLEETLKERSPRAMLERACRPLAELCRRASALASRVGPLNCRQAPAAITRKGYDALPARCDCIRARVGPEHNITFVIYSLGVTLAGNS